MPESVLHQIFMIADPIRNISIQWCKCWFLYHQIPILIDNIILWLLFAIPTTFGFFVYTHIWHILCMYIYIIIYIHTCIIYIYITSNPQEDWKSKIPLKSWWNMLLSFPRLLDVQFAPAAPLAASPLARPGTWSSSGGINRATRIGDGKNYCLVDIHVLGRYQPIQKVYRSGKRVSAWTGWKKIRELFMKLNVINLLFQSGSIGLRVWLGWLWKQMG